MELQLSVLIDIKRIEEGLLQVVVLAQAINGGTRVNFHDRPEKVFHHTL